MSSDKTPTGVPISASVGFPNDDTLPDMYAEGVYVIALPNSMGLVFNRNMGNPASPQPIAVVRMSPEQAKLMLFVLRKAVKDFEAQIGPIPMHGETLVQMGFSKDEKA